MDSGDAEFEHAPDSTIGFRSIQPAFRLKDIAAARPKQKAA
jgi:hypothetical protein